MSTNDKKEALKGVLDLAKQQITLATGIIVFSGTLLKIFLEPEEAIELPSSWLFASWGLLVLSLVFGLFVSGRYITQLSQSQYEIEDRLLAFFSRVQQVLFLAGIIVFGVFAVLAWAGV
jgi:hypothetical protein